MMKKRLLLVLSLFCFLFIVGCASSSVKKEVSPLDQAESKTYRLLKSDLQNPTILKKGDTVKIKIIYEKDYVKVYAYSLNEDYLKTDLCLILFLINDDYSDKGITWDEFTKQLSTVVEIKK